MQDRRKPQSPGEAIYLEARGARQTSQKLLPLLALLSEGESQDGSPLEELKGLLRAILEVLRHQNTILDRLDAAVASNSPSRPLGSSI